MQIQNSSIPGLLPHQQQQQQQPQSQPSSTHSPLPSSSHLAGSAGNTGSIPLRGSPNLSSASAGPALTGPFASNPPPPPRVVPQLQQQQQQQQQHQQMLPPPPNSQQQRDIHDRQARLGTRTPTPGPGGIPPPPVGGVVREQQTVVSDIDPDVTSRDLKKEGSDWVVIWSPKAKKVLDVNLVHNLVHESIVCCVKFSNDGKWLGTGCNRTVQIFDTKTGAKSCVLQDDSTPYNGDLYIRTICFSPDGKLLATGAEDRQIRIWDIKARRIRHLLQGHSQEIYSLEFSSDGRHLVSGSGDKSARIWDIENGACVFDLRVEDFVIGESGPVDAGLTSVAVSPDGRYVAAGSLDAVVRIWDTQTGVQLGRFTGHSDSVYSVAFAPDGSFLCSGSLDRTLRIWDLSPPPPSPPSNSRTLEFMPNGEPGTGYGACHNVLAGHKDYVLSVGVSNDGRWIASGSKDRSVLFFDSATNQPQLMLQGHKNSVISIDLSKSSGLLATGSGDLNARIWRYDSVRD
ncbi:WD40 repeat-containing protein [Phaffia rhodozyma]|uniref:WD40 repeat-containing protein n=1 Tax=Phaffia rhodozyma TaxID=264483 RepID=A0A0F7SJT9_PHARH|nr:WD40 repeat-containing protein [Phaffia rhodozyma]